MDVGIVGGGIIGLACARALLTARPTLRLVVWEREAKLASQQSARSSNVLHAGIYYKPGSERAQLCVAGAEMARRYVIEHDLPARLDAGKLILAVEREELPGLHALMQRGQENGVKDLQLWDEAFLRRKGVKRGVAGIWSPHTGIVDWEQFSLQLARDVVRLGGEIRLSANPTEYLVSGAAKFVLNCAGLQADRVAMTLGGKAEPRLIPIRGNYVKVDPSFLPDGIGMIYPVPNPKFPFLGVHLTRKLGGEVFAGPGASLSLSRNHNKVFNLADLASIASSKGFWKLTLNNAAFAASQTLQAFSVSSFVKQTQRFVDFKVSAANVQGKKFGIRALAVNNDGSIVDDFVFELHGRAGMSIRNASSPAATSSLAIAEKASKIVLNQI